MIDIASVLRDHAMLRSLVAGHRGKGIIRLRGAKARHCTGAACPDIFIRSSQLRMHDGVFLLRSGSVRDM